MPACRLADCEFAPRRYSPAQWEHRHAGVAAEWQGAGAARVDAAAGVQSSAGVKRLPCPLFQYTCDTIPRCIRLPLAADCQAAHHPLCLLCGALLPGARLQQGDGGLHRRSGVGAQGCQAGLSGAGWDATAPLHEWSLPTTSMHWRQPADCACTQHFYRLMCPPSQGVAVVTIEDLHLDITMGGLMIAGAQCQGSAMPLCK